MPASAPPRSPDFSARPTVAAAKAPPASTPGVGRSGSVRHRGRFGSRLNRWRRNSALNPYWLSHQSLTQAARELAPLARGTLLDVGVAERPYAALFAPHVTQYFGLDYPPVLADKEPAFWSLLKRVRQSVDVFGDGQRLPVAPNSVDTVLATEVLEHLPDPALCLREIHRVLRPGGKVLLTVPFQEPLHFLPQDYGRFTPTGLRALLANAGFEVEVLEPRGNSTLALGATLAQWILRAFAARSQQADGSVIPSPWRLALLSPLIALVQIVFALLARVIHDTSQPLGFRAVARKR